MIGLDFVGCLELNTQNFSGIKNGPLEEVTNWVTFFIQKALVENEKDSVDIKVCFEAPGFIHSSQSTRSLLTNKCLIEVDKDGWRWQNYSDLADELSTSSLSYSMFASRLLSFQLVPTVLLMFYCTRQGGVLM